MSYSNKTNYKTNVFSSVDQPNLRLWTILQSISVKISPKTKSKTSVGN